MSGEFNGLIILAVLWFLLSRITSVRRTPPRPHQPEPSARPRVRTVKQTTRMDPTQREGVRLQVLLGDLQRSLEQAAATTRLGDSEARSLEDDVQPESRRTVDLDDEALEVEARRIQAAETRNLVTRTRPAGLEQIKTEPADHTATRSYSAKQLRDAVIWREILGPPVSER